MKLFVILKDSHFVKKNAIWKSTGEWPYFLDNILVEIRIIFLPYCSLVLSLLKHKGVCGIFEPKK